MKKASRKNSWKREKERRRKECNTELKGKGG
jgi:hypothetical protein